MSSLALNSEPLATEVRCTDTELIVTLDDGRTLAAPLMWFPRLANASPKQRATFEIMGQGQGIHWPEVDEDISIRGMLAGRKSAEYRPTNESGSSLGPSPQY